MKNSKWLILILVAALLVVYYLIGSDYLKQRRHNVSLAAQISAGTQALAVIPSPPTDLVQQLAAAMDNLQVAESSFTANTNDTHIVNTVLRLAEEIGVKAIPLGTAPWVTEKVADRDYSVFRVDLEVTGTFNQLLSYLDRLESGEPKTLVVEYLAVEKVEDTSISGSGDASEIPITTNVKIAVYALLPATN
jgi:hypothetical protein